jgi:hypothetical protein
MNCYYCNAEIHQRLPQPPRVSIIERLLPGPRKVATKHLLATKDHIVPRKMTHGQRNIDVVLCCQECNLEKNCLTREEFRVVKAFRYGYISGVEYKFPGEHNLLDKATDSMHTNLDESQTTV